MRERPRLIDRYALFDEIASGGMGVVHVGRLAGSQGFARIVAIKRLHSLYAKDAEFVEMFVDEARLAARVRHPNVVTTLDVVEGEGEILVVMEYVHGETLARVNRVCRDRGGRVPTDVAVAILHGVLQGLHAAHEATTEHGALLGIVHRDVSPQNVMVGADGTPRVLDFGVAKAQWRAVTTREGQLKGKLSYMAPEQVNGLPVDRRVDVYAAGIVLWETLTGARLFEGDNPGYLTAAVLEGVKEPPSARGADVSPELDAVVMRALARNPDERFQNAMEMAIAIEGAARGIATSRRIGAWLAETVPERLAKRAEYVTHVESRSSLDSDPQIEVVVEGTDPTTILRPPMADEPGSLSRAAVTAETVSVVNTRPRALFVAIGVGVAATIIASVIAIAVFVGTRSEAPVSAAASAPPATTSVPPVVAPTSSPQPTAEQSASAVASVAPTTTTAPKPITPVKPTGTTILKPPPPPPAKCDPPYTIDAKGVRVPKRECF